MRDKAKAIIQVDNKLIRVTKYVFSPGAETGIHKHTMDYIVTPITDGNLLLIDIDGNNSYATLISSETYYRKAGVTHNVINNGKKDIVFVETEIKK